jgi:hypothetical protein
VKKAYFERGKKEQEEISRRVEAEADGEREIAEQDAWREESDAYWKDEEGEICYWNTIGE